MLYLRILTGCRITTKLRLIPFQANLKYISCKQKTEKKALKDVWVFLVRMDRISHGRNALEREINLAYQPDFILMGGIDIFVDGGSDRGTRKKANVMLLSKDRVALDAVGLAILKDRGSNQAIMKTPAFQQEQIARAVELDLGVSVPENIEIISDDGVRSKIIWNFAFVADGIILGALDRKSVV